jgi:hypothetical protein
MMAKPFEVVGEDAQTAEPARQESQAALRMLMVALGALSKRFLIALADLFTLTTVASAWWLWLAIPAPDTHQLIALGMYLLFVLAINFIVRRG